MKNVMTRLIDADALIHKLKTAIELGKKVDESTTELEAVLNDVETMPTIDAVPVRHGEWIYCVSSERWECDRCGEIAPTITGIKIDNEMYNAWLSPFCPNCGAEMREEE